MEKKLVQSYRPTPILTASNCKFVKYEKILPALQLIIAEVRSNLSKFDYSLFSLFVLQSIILKIRPSWIIKGHQTSFDYRRKQVIMTL